MKETLYEKVQNLKKDLVEKQKRLEENITTYKENEDWENAMKCDIKRYQYVLFIIEIDKLLK
jgi:cell shape-determining protein MreC